MPKSHPKKNQSKLDVAITTSPKSPLKSDKTFIITFKFDTNEKDLKLTDITAINGTLTELKQTTKDSKKNWSVKFTKKLNGPYSIIFDGATYNLPEKIEINETNFPDTQFRELLTLLDTPNNPIGSLEELIISDLLIEDLKGIELLTCLEKLRISEASITYLDLTKNLSLVSLEIQGNYIKTIDLSKLSKLTNLTLNQMELETIDLTALSNLTYLQISSNNLETIDLSKIKSLEVINLLDNKIKTFKLGESNKLKYLNLNKNLIDEIKLPELKALIRLDLEDNKLKEIYFDFSKLEPITPRFEGDPNEIEVQVTNFPNLRELNISNNQLEEIDLTEHKGLVYLNASSNRLKTIDLKAQTKLKWLDLNSNQLSKLDHNEFKPLKHLDLSNNRFESIDLTLPEGLLYLDIGNNNISVLKPIEITSLKTLKLDNNPFKIIGFSNKLENLLNLSLKSTLITELTLENFPNLEKLDIRSTDLEYVDFKANKKLSCVLTSDNKLISINVN